jgi:hypothetical protein
MLADYCPFQQKSDVGLRRTGRAAQSLLLTFRIITLIPPYGVVLLITCTLRIAFAEICRTVGGTPTCVKRVKMHYEHFLESLCGTK